jgi:hypothetical protein
MNKWLTGEWFIDRSSAHRRRVIHYWATILWLTVGLVAWAILRNALWFVGFMSLYAIWVNTHRRLCSGKPLSKPRHKTLRTPRPRQWRRLPRWSEAETS